jgi:MFS family permease
MAGFRGWWIVGVAFLAQAVAIAFSVITYGLFIPAIEAEFDISVMAANLGVSLLLVVMPLAGLIVGPALDRRSIRAVMCAGALLTAACFALLSIATELWQMAVLFGVGIALGVTMMGPLPATTVVAKWFERRRGLALGIVSMGPPAGGFMLAPLAGALIESVGWRGTLRGYAVGTLLVLPLIWLVVRSRPEEIGQHPDGIPPDASSTDGAAGPAWSSRSILGLRSFWLLALGAGVIFGFISGWSANFPKFAQDLGYGAQQQSNLLGFTTLMAIPGTLLFGALVDRYDGRVLVWIAVAAQVACFALLRTSPGHAWLLVLSGALGFTGNAFFPVYAALLGRIFGPASFGRAMALAGLVLLPFAFAAPLLLGYLRDAAGNYGSALLVLIAFLGLGGGFFSLLPRAETAQRAAAQVG